MKRTTIFAMLLPALLLLAACGDEASYDKELTLAQFAANTFDYNHPSIDCDPDAALDLAGITELLDPENDDNNRWLGTHHSEVANLLADGTADIKIKMEGIDISQALAEMNSVGCNTLLNETCREGGIQPDGTEVYTTRGEFTCGDADFDMDSDPQTDPAGCLAAPWDGSWDKTFVTGGGQAISLPIEAGTILLKGTCIYAEGTGRTQDGKNSKITESFVRIKGAVRGPEFVRGLYIAQVGSKFLNTRIGGEGGTGEPGNQEGMDSWGGDGGWWWLRRDIDPFPDTK